MMLRHESVFSPVRSLNADDTGSKSLKISHLDNTGLYTGTLEELPILLRAAKYFVKNPNDPASFLVPTFYTSGKLFLEG